MKATISKVGGDWAWSLDFNAGYGPITLFFNSLQLALIVKRIIEADELIPQHAAVCDMQEVIRCKDCKFWGDYERCNGIKNGLILENTNGYDYCSYGERKDGAEK